MSEESIMSLTNPQCTHGTTNRQDLVLIVIYMKIKYVNK